MINYFKSLCLLIFCIFSLKANQSTAIIDSLVYERSNYSDNYFRHSNLRLFNDLNRVKLQISYEQSLFLNSNLPNFENYGGRYFPKGYGYYSAFYATANLKYLFVSLNPTKSIIKDFNIQNLPEKKGQFSVLNDVPHSYEPNFLPNTGFKLKFKGIHLGYGNWNSWRGPGIHNSIILSNNSEGFNHYLLEIKNFEKITTNLSFKLKYMISTKFKNKFLENFYSSFIFLDFKYRHLEFGYSKVIQSYYDDQNNWKNINALTTIMIKNHLQNYDEINHFYLLYKLASSKLEFFLEVGIPNRSFGEKSIFTYYDHSMASNIGFRKRNLFGNENLVFGFEYFRALNSLYYNFIPSSNLYDNIKYNYSSHKNRRWASHSGPDSDDFLAFIGYLNSKFELIYEVNYERHGVTYSFPPEIKFESRFKASLVSQKMTFSLFYEREYYEHYGFVDSNYNVWTETFEEGSLQRTNSLIISIQYTLF